MTFAHRRVPAKRADAEGTSEPAIYDGHQLLGTIVTNGGGEWCAYGIDGEQLGAGHPSPWACTDAVLAAARE